MRRTEPQQTVELHIAALPFPTFQGTQAAIRSMLEARARAGYPVALFAYGARGYDLDAPFVIHRAGAAPQLSLRSGPSLAKVRLDLAMAHGLPQLITRLRPRVIVAHHVEAMAIATVAAPDVPTVFFAHTDLAAELPTYARLPGDASRCAQVPLASRIATRGIAWAGAQVERRLCRRATAVAAVSPLLRARLSAAHGCSVQYVPIPWVVPAPMTAQEQAVARQKLRLHASERVALYAGNLDAYQDPERILTSLQLLAAAGQPITLLLATRSQPQAFLRRAASLGVRFRSCELGAEPVRREIHAAADFAIVPRAVAGGLPIKLLDALARGLPCAIMPPSAAGLDLDRCVVRASAPTTEALATAIATLARQPPLRHRLGHHARAYVAQHHADPSFNQTLDLAIDATIAGHHARPPKHAPQPAAPGHA
ncbi:MAG: glycosyltransferase [Polyangiales bacterium]